jgi:hypothetical protein
LDKAATSTKRSGCSVPTASTVAAGPLVGLRVGVLRSSAADADHERSDESLDRLGLATRLRDGRPLLTLIFVVAAPAP